jgi:hypothetical protein
MFKRVSLAAFLVVTLATSVFATPHTAANSRRDDDERSPIQRVIRYISKLVVHVLDDGPGVTVPKP